MKKPLRDPKLKFFVASHKYKYGKQTLTSVTTWLAQFYPHFDANKQAKASNANPNSLYYKLGVRTILKMWKTKTDDGTETHAQIEKYLLTKEMPTDKKALQAVPVIDELFDRLELGNTSSFPEVRVCALELGLAGTIDWAVVTDGGLLIFDWKTNGSLKYSRAKYQAQLNTYSYILENYYGYQVLGMRLVHLTEDAAEVIPVARNYPLIEKYLKEQK